MHKIFSEKERLENLQKADRKARETAAEARKLGIKPSYKK
jgi:hypothetical protein